MKPLSLAAAVLCASLLWTGCKSAEDARSRQIAPAMGIDHGEGANVGSVHGYYGVPILQKSIVWDGNGEDDNFGLGVRALHFVADGLAVGGGLEATLWKQADREVLSGEVEGVGRWYPGWAGLFLDLSGGFVYSADPVPAGGTVWNFSFSFGPGYEIPIGSGTALQFGADYHHISNALGQDNPRNPSQNEVRTWIGFSWSF